MKRGDLARQCWQRVDAWGQWVRSARANLVRRWRRRTYCAQNWLLMRVSFATIARAAKLHWLCRSLFDVRWRWNGILRYETGRELFSLARAKWLVAMAGGVQERLIDRRIHVGQRKSKGVEHLPDLVAVGRQIADVVERMWVESPKRLVILSPLHYVSQYANVLVVHEVQRALGLANIAIVSGVPHNQYGSDEGLTPGIEILHTYGDGIRNSLGIRLARSLMRDRVVVLFADAAPYSMQKYPMDTVEVNILGRPSRIHGGIFRLGQRLDVLLLPYYLTFERGKFGVVLFDPVDLADGAAPQRVADCIGRALMQNYESNLFAGFPALYGFAPAR